MYKRQEVVNALGRRKRAVARVFVSEGKGKITINKRDLAQYFPSTILQYVVKQPLNKLEAAEKYDIKVNPVSYTHLEVYKRQSECIGYSHKGNREDVQGISDPTITQHIYGTMQTWHRCV